MLAYLFVILAVIARFVAVPVGVTPVTGSLLFFGAYGSRRQLWFPFALLAASDVVLTKLVYHFIFSWDHFVTWAWYAAIIWLGTKLRGNIKPLWVVGSALASSVSESRFADLRTSEHVAASDRAKSLTDHGCRSASQPYVFAESWSWARICRGAF